MMSTRRFAAMAMYVAVAVAGAGKVRAQAITASATVSSSVVVYPGGVTVTGAATKDPTRPGPISMSWSGAIFDEPSASTNGNSGTLSSGVTFPAPGEYLLTFTASIPTNSASATVKVTVVPAAVCSVGISASPDNQQVTLPAGASVTASATSSGGCTGPLQITWSGGGPGPVQISPASTSTTSHGGGLTSSATFTAPGSYTLTATAASDGKSDSKSVTVEVIRPPAPCTLSASITPSVQTVFLPGSAPLSAATTLSGNCVSGSVDIAWSASGPGTVSFSNQTGATTAATFSATGTYQITARATGAGQTTSAFATVEVSRPDACAAAVSAAPASQTIAPGAAATVRATASTASNCRPHISWRATGPGEAVFSNETVQETGDTADSTVAVTFTRTGEYTLTASSTPAGPASSAAVKVIVTDGACSVAIQAAPPTQTVKVGAPASVTASATKEGACASPLEVAWSGSGPGLFSFENPRTTTPGNSATLASKVTFTEPGTYLLTATGMSGSAAPKRVTITVLVVKGDPLTCSVAIRASVEGGALTAGQPVRIGATASKAAGSGGALTVSWSGEGLEAITLIGGSSTTTSDEMTVAGVAIFPAAGEYRLVARAVAGDCKVEDGLRLTVEGGSPGSLSAVAFPKTRTVRTGEAATFTGVAARSGDVPGPMTLGWSYTGADSGSARLSNTSSVAPGLSGTLVGSATFSKAGVYELQFSASAGSRTASDNVTVIAVDPANPCEPMAIAAAPVNQTVLLGTRASVNAVATKPACLGGPMTVTWTASEDVAFLNAAASGPPDRITLASEATFRRTGTYILTAVATAAGYSKQTSITVTVDRLHIEADLPPGIAGAPYSGRFRVLNDMGPFRASIDSGSLPDGLFLGDPRDPLLISGTPLTGDEQPARKQEIAAITVAAKGCAADAENAGQLVCSFAARISNSRTGATNCVEAEDCDVFTIKIQHSGTPSGPKLDRFDSPQHCAVPAGSGFGVGVRGGAGPFEWTVNGARLSETSRRVNIPVAGGSEGLTTVNVEVRDSRGLTDSASYQVTVVPAFGGEGLGIEDLPDGTVGEAYLERLKALGGMPDYTWASTDSVPAGLRLSAEGLLRGIPEKTGFFKATVLDGGARFCAESLEVEVDPRLDAPEAPLPTGNVNTKYDADLSATGGKAPYDWSVAGGGSGGNTPQGCPVGAAPLGVPGLGMTRAGKICGTPASAGTFRLSLEVRDAGNVRLSDGNTGPRRRTVQRVLTVRDVQFTPPVLSPVIPQSTYSQTVTAQGATGTLHWEAKPECAAAAGRIAGIPKWLVTPPFDGVSYRVTGVPDPADWGKTYCFSIEVSEAGAVLLKRDFELRVLACPTLSLPAAAPGTALPITATFPASGFQVTSYSQSFTPDPAFVRGAQTDPAWDIVQPATLRVGTVAGSSSLSAAVAAGDIRYTCSAVARVTLPASAPVVNDCIEIASTGSGFTITTRGYSSTREITAATFTFEPKSGHTLPRASFDITGVQDLFSQFFTGRDADGRGAFIYDQQFNIKDIKPDELAAVTVLMRNAVGPSAGKRATFENRTCPAQ